jgi:hypothetical protein
MGKSLKIHVHKVLDLTKLIYIKFSREENYWRSTNFENLYLGTKHNQYANRKKSIEDQLIQSFLGKKSRYK